MAFACLMYHSLADGRFPDHQHPRYTTTRAAFAEHLVGLRRHRFHVGGFADLLERARCGKELPARYVLLSFDDGHRSSLDLADLMDQAGVRGTFFLTRDYCRDRSDFLKPADVRRLADAGFDFGTHGVTHRALSRMPDAAMRRELSDSKGWLEDVLGRPVTCVSLPAGQGSDAVRDAAFELGYVLIGNSVERLNDRVRLPGLVNRLVVLRGYSGHQVRKIAAGSRAYMLRRRMRAAVLAMPKRLTRSYDQTRG